MGVTMCYFQARVYHMQMADSGTEHRYSLQWDYYRCQRCSFLFSHDNVINFRSLVHLHINKSVGAIISGSVKELVDKSWKDPLPH